MKNLIRYLDEYTNNEIKVQKIRLGIKNDTKVQSNET